MSPGELPTGSVNGRLRPPSEADPQSVLDDEQTAQLLDRDGQNLRPACRIAWSAFGLRPARTLANEPLHYR